MVDSFEVDGEQIADRVHLRTERFIVTLAAAVGCFERMLPLLLQLRLNLFGGVQICNFAAIFRLLRHDYRSAHSGAGLGPRPVLDGDGKSRAASLVHLDLAKPLLDSFFHLVLLQFVFLRLFRFDYL